MFEQKTARRGFIAILAAIGFSFSGCGNKSSIEPMTVQAGNSTGTYSISMQVDPNRPADSKVNTFHVTVQDRTGKLVSDAQVHLTLTMPAMPLKERPEMKKSANLPWTGTDYSGPIQVMMTGRWTVDVEVRRGREVMPRYQTYFHAN